MRKTFLLALVAVLAIAALGASTGCRRVRLRDTPEYRSQTDRISVPMQGATTVNAELRMGLGEFRLSAEPTSAVTTGTTDASATVLAGSVTYSPSSFKPVTDYAVNGGRGTLRFEQPEGSHIAIPRRLENRWDLRLPAGVPTELRLVLGVGKSTADLRGLDLLSLDAETGVGDATIDLSGPRTRNLSARIEAGVGSLRLILPRGVGVRVTGARDGVGDFEADGLFEKDGALENAAYAGAGPKIDIELRRGVGHVRLELTD